MQLRKPQARVGQFLLTLTFIIFFVLKPSPDERCDLKKKKKKKNKKKKQKKKKLMGR
ncbi:hypothetical protein HanIR_Chr01g0015911 [Helianthus annuus]|nr:hypothetical protein HanIR_Chr01g0015911 [Helianthus annuus]